MIFDIENYYSLVGKSNIICKIFLLVAEVATTAMGGHCYSCVRHNYKYVGHSYIHSLPIVWLDALNSFFRECECEIQ